MTVPSVINGLPLFQNTALHIAARYNQPRAVSLLLKLDCKLSYNDAGFSAIDYALQKKFVDVVYLMVTDSKRYCSWLNLQALRLLCLS